MITKIVLLYSGWNALITSETRAYETVRQNPSHRKAAGGSVCTGHGPWDSLVVHDTKTWARKGRP
jgi:hypothetical protein